MTQPLLIQNDTISDKLLTDLDRREVALWLCSLPKDPVAQDELVEFLGLPWRMILSEVSERPLVEALEKRTDPDDPITRKRGFIQVVDGDPSRIELPRRCLPVYLLNGRQTNRELDFQSRYQRMAMLEKLRRSGVRQLLIISGDDDPIPSELKDLWSSGFRAYLAFVTDAQDATTTLETWAGEVDGLNALECFSFPAGQIVADTLHRFAATYPEERVVIRLRDRSGNITKLDVTEVDDPERPLLDQYDLIQARDLLTLTPEQISEEEFASFFENPVESWRPYAAGIPWGRRDQSKHEFSKLLKKIDAAGPEENCIAYVMAEPGAGGTTFSRMLAWESACEGYPVLVAKTSPFSPDALPLANFLNRVRVEQEASNQTRRALDEKAGEATEADNLPSRAPHYEVPWIIVFDRVHWEYRASELQRFRNEMEKQGRPICLLVVSGPIRELAYYNGSVFHQVGELNHALDQEDARALGRHLNKFLSVYKKQREEWQWDQFYREHSVRYVEGTSAFWVTLSFWIQAQYDLSESVQQWMYRCFKEKVDKGTMRHALLEIAALSAERLPMPDEILPTSQGEWPVSHLLQDSQSNFGPLGLIRITSAGEKYWALAHDILGRFLIAALFHDFPMRNEMGFGEAKDPEHLRFLILKRISSKSELGEVVFRKIADDFATSIFKIDPDHGHATFAPFWREVLDALDGMPRTLQDASRVYRHHTAISRRRIAKYDDSFYGVTIDDKITLLKKAIEDVNYALEAIAYTPGSEPDLNLYNSLAHAYHDLADVEHARGVDSAVVTQLRKLANDATRRAYEENPSNSFVIETYVRNLLATAGSNPVSAIQACIEALVILFSAVSSNEETYRRARLGDLADQALELLFTHAPKSEQIGKPTSPIEVLTKAWIVLVDGIDERSGTTLSDLPEPNRICAIDILAHPAGQGNMQIIRLNYDLISSTYPKQFTRQLEYLEQLQSTDYRLTSQLRVEYGILLYQTDRSREGDEVFRVLRQVWRESEQFIQVPSRLRWLREKDDSKIRTVQAIVGSDRDLRAMARVSEFQQRLVPFRTEEFGMRDARPGTRFSCHVSFSHNGPFLRPVTARTT